jgi:hypothetical protein
MALSFQQHSDEIRMKTFVLTSLLATSTLESAQNWLSVRCVRVMVLYPAVSGVDFVSRTVSYRLGELLKTHVHGGEL